MELVGSRLTFSSHLAPKSHNLKWLLDLKSLEWCKGSEMQNANGSGHAWTTFSFKTVYFLYLWDNLSPIAKQDQNSFNPFPSATQNLVIILRITWLWGGWVFPCKATTALFLASETSILAPIPCCNSKHLWRAPPHHMERLCLRSACDRLDSTLLHLLLQFGLSLCISLLWFERSPCLLMKYDTPVRETTEYLIFRALTCPKEYTLSQQQRGGCQKMGKELPSNEAKWFRNTNKI